VARAKLPTDNMNIQIGYTLFLSHFSQLNFFRGRRPSVDITFSAENADIFYLSGGRRTLSAELKYLFKSFCEAEVVEPFNTSINMYAVR
jgi:hypothetical protein